MNFVGTTWHSPLNASGHLLALSRKVGIGAIDKEGKYKKVREARSAMVVATAMYRLSGKPTYFRLLKNDPPDAMLMQASDDAKGTLSLLNVEISSYRNGGGATFLEQLKRTKAPKRHILSEKDILVYEVPDHNGIDFGQCRDYLNSINAPYGVWVLRIEQTMPDTVASIVTLNPDVKKITLNVGEIAYKLKQQNMPPVIFPKRVATPDKVRLRPSRPYHFAPWEDLS